MACHSSAPSADLPLALRTSSTATAGAAGAAGARGEQTLGGQIGQIGQVGRAQLAVAKAREALTGLEGLVAPLTQGGANCSAGGGGESVAATGGAVASGAAVSHAVLSVLGDLVAEIEISTRYVSLEISEIEISSPRVGASGSSISGGGAAMLRRRSSGDIAPVMMGTEGKRLARTQIVSPLAYKTSHAAPLQPSTPPAAAAATGGGGGAAGCDAATTALPSILSSSLTLYRDELATDLVSLRASSPEHEQRAGVMQPKVQRKWSQAEGMEGETGATTDEGVELPTPPKVTPAVLERKRSGLRPTPPSGCRSGPDSREVVSLRPTPQLERRPSDPEAKPQRCRRGIGAGDLWAGKYDVGSGGTPEALRKQLLALQKQPAAMRALRDAMLLEGKVTQSGL